MITKKLICFKGLPGSGKSTQAIKMVEDDPSGKTVRVNKDEIRIDLEKRGWTWSNHGEVKVIQERDNRIKKAYSTGAHVVISDDTNLAPKHETRLRQLAAQAHVEFELIDLLDVPIETCIERDSKRVGKAQVGERVIKGMLKQHNKYLEEARFAARPKFEPYVSNLQLPDAIICDLDGTLSLFGEGTSNDRSPYNAVNADKDEPNWPVVDVLRAMFDKEVHVVFMSGREDKFRPQTLTFLKNLGFDTFPLFMRTTGDKRKDWIVKGELFDAHIRSKYNVLFCLDDRNQVVEFYRSLGLKVWQVANGDF